MIKTTEKTDVIREPINTVTLFLSFYKTDTAVTQKIELGVWHLNLLPETNEISYGYGMRNK